MALAISLAAAIPGFTQEVHVSQVKNHVSLSIAAQQPYQLSFGAPKTPVLEVQCALKGTKGGHLITFQPGTPLTEADTKGGAQSLKLMLDGLTLETEWMPYGEAATFAYYGKTEVERLAFLQQLMNSKMLAIEFKPFLTGSPIVTTFQLEKLREGILGRPECALK